MFEHDKSMRSGEIFLMTINNFRMKKKIQLYSSSQRTCETALENAGFVMDYSRANVIISNRVDGLGGAVKRKLILILNRWMVYGTMYDLCYNVKLQNKYININYDFNLNDLYAFHPIPLRSCMR